MSATLPAPQPRKALPQIAGVSWEHPADRAALQTLRAVPGVDELIVRHGSSVPDLLRFLEREGRIVQVDADRYYDRSTLEEMIQVLREQLAPGTVYVPAQLRDMLGLSRKYLIPFLEFCDRKGVTERRGEGRVLRESSAVVLDTPQPQS